MADLTGVLAIVMVFGIPLAAILTRYHLQALAMQLKLREAGGEDLRAQIADLRQQISDLRDTATRYDLSFDAALQRIESRVGRLEERLQSVEQAASSGHMEGTPTRRLEL